MQDKFRSCTADVQRSTLHYNNPKPNLLYVYKHTLRTNILHVIQVTCRTSLGVVQSVYKNPRFTTLTLSLSFCMCTNILIDAACSRNVSNMQNKLQSGAAVVHAPQLIETTLRLCCSRCTSILLGSVRCI